ncbi:KGK family protein [Limnospira fusiformis KN01]|uniref:KGK family protein n=2 Tax=Limnospira TaxID=2596745 RepID=A0A9P1KKT7_9CYAN|nr:MULTISPECIES: KGK domain-containing protein [Limnospira]EKD08938.1 hypothetical protein SPLC1_S203390 [Arthrospira platensis C1]MDY7053432.1 KGK family protein [Limnospira fusiformis LS22]MDT9186198.1 KGK family protein [Limnospira sp. PMC 894.15]MDT9196534.1 KGK family protein [Limnospira sp. PMC 1042.18]MDT9232205.1 KGK family protein [Limnospira sp. PMC 917.15]
MNNLTRILDDNDVLHTGSSTLMFQCTFKVSEFLTMMQSKLEEENLFGEGIECELLTPGGPWEKGRFQICLEFVSDNVTSAKAIPSVDYGMMGGSDTPEVLPAHIRRQTQRIGMWS